MENIVLLEDLDKFTEQVLIKIATGLAAARKAGVHVDNPKEVTISCVVVDKFQHLETAGGTETVTESRHGGKTTEKSKGNELQMTGSSGTTLTTRNSIDTMANENVHDSQTKTTEQYEQ